MKYFKILYEAFILETAVYAILLILYLFVSFDFCIFQRLTFDSVFQLLRIGYVMALCILFLVTQIKSVFKL